MIDLHSHFLPGIDDGAKNAAESTAMLVDSYKQGVKVCAGTPHLFIHSPQAVEEFLKKRQSSVDILRDYLNKEQKEQSVPKLIFGAEVFLESDISQFDFVEELCITGTKLILLELSYNVYEPRYAEWFYNLGIKGITPVLAHIERYSYLDRLLKELGDVEAVLQMNAATLCSFSAKTILSKVLNCGKTVIASSDMHNVGMRKCFMEKAYKKIHRSNNELADDMFYGNAAEFLEIQ